MQRLCGRWEQGKSELLKEGQSGWKAESGGNTVGDETVTGRLVQLHSTFGPSLVYSVLLSLLLVLFGV